MIKSPPRARSKLNSPRRKALTAIVLATLLSGLSISPAFADRDGNPGRGHRNGNQHEREWRYDRDGHRYYDNRYYGPAYRPPYRYAQPVYVPPPVYYEPRQSPGISLFFPLDQRRR